MLFLLNGSTSPRPTSQWPRRVAVYVVDLLWSSGGAELLPNLLLPSCGAMAIFPCAEAVQGPTKSDPPVMYGKWLTIGSEHIRPIMDLLIFIDLMMLASCKLKDGFMSDELSP